MVGLWLLMVVASPGAPPNTPAPPLPAELLGQLTAIEEEAVRLDPAKPLEARTPQLAFVLGGIHQGVTNVYADDRARYLAVQLHVLNTTDAPQTLDVQSIRLKSGLLTLKWQNRPAGIDGYSFQAGQTHITIREVQPPDALSIPAGSVASTWILFAGLELGSFVPELVLELPAEPRPIQLDVNLYQRAALRMKSQRVGPAECLALVTIGGTLNTVNAGALATQLETLATSGTHRVVVAFDPEATVPNQFLLDWIKQAWHPNPYQFHFKQMPVFPGTLQELHLVVPKLGKHDGEDSANLHTRLDEAVAMSLESAFAAASAEDVVTSLRSEHPSVRVAALRHGAGRLRPEQLPLVLRMVSAPEPEVRQAALGALGEFSAPEATAKLVEQARSKDAAIVAAAVRSLAASRYPAAHAALAELIPQGLALPPQQLVAILSSFPRPEWREAVLKLTTSNDSKVQQAAMQALARLGHTQLMEVLLAGLESPEARVREEAFLRLRDLGTREADEAALQYALERLKTEPPTASIHHFLIRVRDQRAVPLLVRYLDQPEGIRRSVIELLSQIGDQSVAAELVQRYPRFTDLEKEAALQALQLLDSPMGKPLAIEALTSDDMRLVQRSVGYLQVDGDDAVVAAMAKALETWQGRSGRASIHFICNGLGVIGSPAAREVLLATRRSMDDDTRRSAQQGLQVLWNQSPARELVAWAEGDLLMAERLKRAETLPETPDEGSRLSAKERGVMLSRRLQSATQSLEVAKRVDPHFPELALRHGELHLLKNEMDAAIAEFRLAIELNDEMVEAHIALGQALYNTERFEEALVPLAYAFEHDQSERQHQWLTSQALAMVRLGRRDEGLELIRKHADQFPDEPVFDYNQACVYGRVIEHLKQDANVAADDPRLAIYAEESLRLLEQAFAHDVSLATREPDMLAFTRKDPDLFSLHEVPAFRKFTEMDVPEEQRTKPRVLPRIDDEF